MQGNKEGGHHAQGYTVMLVLTRKLNQSIQIGDEVEITVVEVRGDQVRLAIAAPRDLAVHRKEMYLQIQQEGRAMAACAQPPVLPRSPCR